MPRPKTSRKKCIGCGGCCGHYLPMTSAEIAQIRLHTVVNMIEPRPDPVDCPWLKRNRTCAIYKVRPAICRAYHCERDLEGHMPGKPEDYHIYNTSRLFIDGDERTYDGLAELAGAFGAASFHALFGGGEDA